MGNGTNMVRKFTLSCRRPVPLSVFWICSMVLLFGGCHQKPSKIPPEAVWKEVKIQAKKHSLDPAFVYAIAFAESSFNENADSGYARGIMQVSKNAWEQVSSKSYRKAWNWKTNIEVGTAYLAWTRDRLVKSRHFTYPLLAAAYRHGYGHVSKNSFDIKKLEKPRNKTYQAIFSGNIHPVAIP